MAVVISLLLKKLQLLFVSLISKMFLLVLLCLNFVIELKYQCQRWDKDPDCCHVEVEVAVGVMIVGCG